MTDEEKKAINQLKADTSFYDYEIKNGNYIYELFKIEVYKKDVDVILNLIEKQQKEIEELKEKNYYLPAWVNKKYVSKDKIKAKIEEIEANDKKYKNYLKDGRENFTPEYVWARTVLQSLLEEKE